MVDRATFLEEVEPMLARLYSTAYYMVRSRADAEDAVQQGLMKAWAARDRARADTFRAWLTRIVINECHNIQRQRMRIIPTEALAAEDGAFTPPDLDLYEAIKQLPEAIRIPFMLKYQMCLSEQEVAFAMRLPKSTIKNRLAKARKRLRCMLNDWEVTFE